MKILVLHGTSDLYGSGKILLTAVQTLVSANHSVILLLSEEGPLSNAMRASGVEVRIIRLGILRKKYFSFEGFFNRIIVLKKAYASIKKIIREDKIDLIYSNTTTVIIGAIAAKLNRVKHIWHVHEMIVKPKFMYHFNGYFLQRFGQHIIAVSGAVKQHWLKYVEAGKITVIHNGIDTTLFENTKGELRKELDLGDDTLLIGMIGRVNIFKGQEYFLEIASLLVKKYKNVKFILVGDAYRGYEYLYDKINGIIKEKELEEYVYDLKYRTDIPNIINSLNVIVLPSQFPDSFPTVILEAMAASIPVVATEQGGAAEMIENNVSGYLIPLQDAVISANKISALIDDVVLRETFGSKGKERLHQLFTLQTFQKKIVQYIESVD